MTDTITLPVPVIEELLSTLKGVRDELVTLKSEFDAIVQPRTVLVSCNEAARLLGCTPTTVSTMIRQKELEKLTIKGVSGIPLSSIERLQASR